MRPGDGLRALQVRQRAGDLQQPVRRPQRQCQPFAGLLQPGLVNRLQRAMPTQPLEVEEGVGAALPALLQRPCLGHSLANAGAGLATGLVGQHGTFPGYRQVQVDTVEQWAGQLVAVALNLFAAAPAAAGGVAQVTAGAGVHGRHQLEARREAHPVLGPGHHDLAGLQRFAQHLQHSPFELGQFVEKQHAMVRQGDLAGLRPAAPVGFRNSCETITLEGARYRFCLHK